MNVLIAIWVCASAGVAAYAALTLPSWLFASMNRSTLWRLRDRVFDERRSGALPEGDEVDEFIRYLETLIIVLPKVSPLQVWWFRRFHGGILPTSTRRETLFRHQSLAPFQDELYSAIFRQYLVGSWSGLALLVALPERRAALRALLSAPYPESPRPDSERRREYDVVTEVEQVVPHLGKRTEKDLMAAAG